MLSRYFKGIKVNADKYYKKNKKLLKSIKKRETKAVRHSSKVEGIAALFDSLWLDISLV